MVKARQAVVGDVSCKTSLYCGNPTRFHGCCLFKFQRTSPDEPGLLPREGESGCMYVCVRGRLSPTSCSRYRYGTAAKIHFTVRPIPQNCGIGNYKPGVPKPSRSVCIDYPGSVAAVSGRRVKWIFTNLPDAAPPQCHGCDGSRSLFPSRMSRRQRPDYGGRR